MAKRAKKPGIVCRSPVDFERVFLPRSFERKEKERVLKEPGGFGKNLEKELMRCIRKGGSSEGDANR
jgi:hypothetical protein